MLQGAPAQYYCAKKRNVVILLHKQKPALETYLVLTGVQNRFSNAQQSPMKGRLFT